MNKGKIRTRRLTIRAKILIPSIIIVVLVCGYNSYTRFEKSMVRMGVEEADMAATIVADSLDANLVYKVTVGSAIILRTDYRIRITHLLPPMAT